MCNRVFGRLGAVTLLMLVVLSAPALVAAQAPSGAAPVKGIGVREAFDPDAAIKAAVERAKAAAATANWTPPRTPWGDPDLQGYWLLSTYTPLERPKELAGKPFYTEEEAVAAFRKAVIADAGVDPKTVHYDWKEYGMDAWQSPVRPNLHTSLIVDPPDGRLPPRTPESQKRQAVAAAAARVISPLAGVSTYGNLYTRCITGLEGPPLVRGGMPGSDSAAQAAGVSAESQIVQIPGYVLMYMQSNSDVRIVPLDGRPHLAQDVREWLGDPRGRWEGNTLVVETSNFKDASPGTNFQGSTDALHLVERFTLVNPKTIRYEYTVSDPKTWTRPWSAESPLPRIEPPIYEFACHEHNYGLINLVVGSQIRQAEREKAAKQGQSVPNSPVDER